MSAAKAKLKGLTRVSAAVLANRASAFRLWEHRLKNSPAAIVLSPQITSMIIEVRSRGFDLGLGGVRRFLKKNLSVVKYHNPHVKVDVKAATEGAKLTINFADSTKQEVSLYDIDASQILKSLEQFKAPS